MANMIDTLGDDLGEINFNDLTVIEMGMDLERFGDDGALYSRLYIHPSGTYRVIFGCDGKELKRYDRQGVPLPCDYKHSVYAINMNFYQRSANGSPVNPIPTDAPVSKCGAC